MHPSEMFLQIGMQQAMAGFEQGEKCFHKGPRKLSENIIPRFNFIIYINLRKLRVGQQIAVAWLERCCSLR